MSERGGTMRNFTVVTVCGKDKKAQWSSRVTDIQANTQEEALYKATEGQDLGKFLYIDVSTKYTQEEVRDVLRDGFNTVFPGTIGNPNNMEKMVKGVKKADGVEVTIEEIVIRNVFKIVLPVGEGRDSIRKTIRDAFDYLISQGFGSDGSELRHRGWKLVVDQKNTTIEEVVAKKKKALEDLEYEKAVAYLEIQKDMGEKYGEN